jgi:hypothetical protein
MVEELLDAIGVYYNIKGDFGVLSCEVLVHGCICYVINYLDNT